MPSEAEGADRLASAAQAIVARWHRVDHDADAADGIDREVKLVAETARKLWAAIHMPPDASKPAVS